MPERETVLIVDDEQLVLDVGGAMLKQIGYRFISALSGKEALELFEEHREQVGCVILDLSMPGMDGRQCLKEMRRIDPAIRILLSSGYREDQTAAMFREGEAPDAFIQKPFVVATLSAKLKALTV